MQIVHPSQNIWRADVTKSKKILTILPGHRWHMMMIAATLKPFKLCVKIAYFGWRFLHKILWVTMAVEEEDENVLKFMRLALAEVLLACLFSPEFLEYPFPSNTFGSWNWYKKSFVQARHALARLEVPVGYICSPNCKWVVNLWRT